MHLSQTGISSITPPYCAEKDTLSAILFCDKKTIITFDIYPVLWQNRAMKNGEPIAEALKVGVALGLFDRDDARDAWQTNRSFPVTPPPRSRITNMAASSSRFSGEK